MKISFVLFAQILILLFFVDTKVAELKSLPNLYLSSNQIIRLNPSNYFSGFNLSFSNGSPSNKFSRGDALPIVNSDVQTTKIISGDYGSLVVILSDNSYLSFFNYSKQGSIISNWSADFSSSEIEEWIDINFFNESILIADCIISSTNYYLFINISNSSIISTYTNPMLQKFKSNSNIIVLNRENFTDVLLTYRSKGLIFLDLLRFDLNLTKIGVKTRTMKNEKNLPYDAKFTKNGNIVIVGQFGIRILQSKLKIISQIDIGVKLLNVEVNVISNMTIITASSNDSIYDFNWINKNLTFNSRYHQKNSYINGSCSTQNYVLGLKENVLNVYNRGYPSYRNLFLQLQLDSTPLYILATNMDSVVIISNQSIAAYNFTEVYFEFSGTAQSSKIHHAINIISQNFTEVMNITRSIVIFTFGHGDSTITSFLDRSPIFLKEYNQNVEIYTDEYFLGPSLNYTFNISAEYKPHSVYIPQFENFTLNFSANFAAIFFESNILRIFLQPLNEANVFEYNCNSQFHIKGKSTSNNLNCTLKDSTEDVGGIVIDIFDQYPNYDTFFIKNNRNQTQAYITIDSDIDTLMKIAPSNGSCDTYYQSIDNLLESNIFCTQGSVIYVYKARVFDTAFSFDLGSDAYQQILSDSNFPGLIFVSNSTNILIVENFFYTKQPVILSSIRVSEKLTKFHFIITSNFLVIISETSNEILQYNIKRPNAPVYCKKFFLLGYTLKAQKYLIAYSAANQLLYILASFESVDYILCIQPNNLGNTDLKYVIPISESTSDPYSYRISVTGNTLNIDYLLITNTAPWAKLIIVEKYPSIKIEKNYLTDLSKLYTEVPFNLIASNPKGDLYTAKCKLVVVNSMRQITTIAEPSLFALNEPGAKTYFFFKPSDFFSGPAFNITLLKPFLLDNLSLRSTVSNFQKTDVNMLGRGVIDIFRTRNYIALLSANYQLGDYYVEIFNTTHFPKPEAYIFSVSINKNTTGIDSIECFTLKISNNQKFLAVDCFALNLQTRFFFIQSVSNQSLSGPYYPLLNSKEQTHYTLVDNYIFYVTKRLDDAVSVLYCNITNGSIVLTKKHSIPKSDLFIDFYEHPLCIDGAALPDDDIALIIATGTTGFNMVKFNSTSHKVTHLENFLDLFTEDYLKSYNDPPIFSVIKILSVRQSSVSNFELFMLAENAFAYSIQVRVDLKNWEIVSAVSNYGLIRYQSYLFRPKVIVADYGFFLIADYIPDNAIVTTNYFYYDITQKPAADTRNKLFDATNILSAPYYNSSPGIVLNQYGYQFLYIVTNNVTDTLNAYAIRSSYLVSTTASHLTSTYMDIIASNGVFNSTYRINIQNYTAFLQGTSSSVIVLIVFGVITFLFCILMMIRKVFSDKGKKLLKDSQNLINYDPNQPEQLEYSTYFKIED